MKLINPDNPVTSTWLAEQGYRLDPRPYLSGAFEARKLLERLPHTEPLKDVVRHELGIFHPGRVTRQWVHDPDYGVPYFSSTDILEADFTYLPLVSQVSVKENPYLCIEPHWILITRSGTVGRMAYARPDTDGFACSEHVLRVIADQDRIPSGYLYSFLASEYGSSLITGSAYGAIVQHIEPHHIADIGVPRFEKALEQQIHDLIQEAAQLRVRYQSGVVDATADLFASAGLPELVNFQWHKHPRDLGFSARGLTPTSLRALNFSPRAQELLDKLRSVPHRTLGEVCEGGVLSRGNRFTRVDSDPEHGVQLIGQRQGFWLRPQGRWVTLPDRGTTALMESDETILVASRGTLGENEVYCRPILVTGNSLRYAYSEDFLQVVPGCSEMTGAYLFALFRSEVGFRLFRSMSTGGKQQDIHADLRKDLPVPLCTPADRERVAEKVRRAYRERDLADDKEDEALRLLDKAVREAAR